MLLSGTRVFSYAAPTTYKRITPDRGCGFILKRIWDLMKDPENTYPDFDPTNPHPTKKDIYRGTKWENRPGFASLLWGALLEDGLIASDDGMVEYNGCQSHGSRQYRRYSRANGHFENGKFTVRYHLTEKGDGVLREMLDHRMEKKIVAAKKAFAELENMGIPANEDTLQKEAVDCAKLAADYAGENQTLRAEKGDMNELLKKLADRLVNLETEIAATRNELDSLINWDK